MRAQPIRLAEAGARARDVERVLDGEGQPRERACAGALHARDCRGRRPRADRSAQSSSPLITSRDDSERVIKGSAKRAMWVEDKRPRSRGALRPSCRCSRPSHPMKRGDGAPVGATFLKVHVPSQARGAFRRAIAAFSLRRRAALSWPIRVARWIVAPVAASSAERPPKSAGPVRPSSASSWQAGISAAGQSPDAARVRGLRSHARGHRTGEGPELPGARHRRTRLFSGASFNSSRLTTPHEAPLNGRG